MDPLYSAIKWCVYRFEPRLIKQLPNVIQKRDFCDEDLLKNIICDKLRGKHRIAYIYYLALLTTQAVKIYF